MSKQFEADAGGGTSDLPLYCRQFTEYSFLPMAAMEGSIHIVRHVNPAFCSWVGKNKENLIGKPFAEVVTSEDGWLMSCLDRVDLTGKPETVHGLFSLWPVHATDERTVGVMIQILETARFHRQATELNEALMLTAVRYHELKEEEDRLNVQLQAEIAERKDVEERLRASLQAHRDLQAAVDQHSIVAITDLRGRITYVNDMFCAISKYSREELLGQDHRIINSGFHPKEFIRELWKTIGHGKVWKGEIKNRAKDGTFYWLETTLIPSLDTAGKPFQYVAIRTDITARKNYEIALLEAQRNAERANRAKDEFIAALSHELRTPLTPVLLIASSLEADEHLDPGLRAQIELIRQNVELEATLIDDLLDITKIERGKILLRREDIDVHQLLFRVLDTVGEDFLRKRMNVEIHADARHSLANADPTRIQQVFWNVIKNAAKFTPEDGGIHVRTFNPNNQTLTIEIRDTGMGIAPEHLPALFVSFEQGAAAGIQRFGGLGLGLTIARALVELHGGDISATSEGVDHGATFTIHLPVSESVTAVPPSSPDVPKTESASHLRILLVEDHENTRTIMAHLLSREGHDVEAVGTCMAAIQAAKAAGGEGAMPFQALISDLGLPDGSGLNLIREIKAQFPEINAIAVSGYGTDEDIRRSTEAGFKQHLVKPIRMEAIRRALAA